MTRMLLTARADTRIRDETARLPISIIAVTADLRVADVILAAEAERGVPLLSEPEHGPEGRAPSNEAGFLRGVSEAVAEFRIGGPAVLPEAMRQRRIFRVKADEGVELSNSGGRAILTARHADLEALQAEMAAHGASVERCQAEGCGTPTCADGKPLKMCDRCRLVKYCSRECQVRDWRAHKRACASASKSAGNKK